MELTDALTQSYAEFLSSFQSHLYVMSAHVCFPRATASLLEENTKNLRGGIRVLKSIAQRLWMLG